MVLPGCARAGVWLAFAAAEPEDIKIELEDLSSYNRWPWIRGTFPAILLNQSSVILLS